MAVPARSVWQLPRTTAGTAPRRVRAPSASRRPTGRLPFVLLSLVIVGVLVTALVSAQALVSQASFRLEELARRAERLEARYGQRRLEIAELTTPDRMVQAARRAGLVRAGRIEVLVVPPRAHRAAPEEPPGAGTLAHARTGP